MSVRSEDRANSFTHADNAGTQTAAPSVWQHCWAGVQMAQPWTEQASSIEQKGGWALVHRNSEDAAEVLHASAPLHCIDSNCICLVIAVTGIGVLCMLSWQCLTRVG